MALIVSVVSTTVTRIKAGRETARAFQQKLDAHGAALQSIASVVQSNAEAIKQLPQTSDTKTPPQ